MSSPERLPFGQQEIDPVSQQEFIDAVLVFEPDLSTTLNRSPFDCREGDFVIGGVGINIAVDKVMALTSYCVKVKEPAQTTETGVTVRKQKVYQITESVVRGRIPSYREDYYRLVGEDEWKYMPTEEDEALLIAGRAVSTEDEEFADAIMAKLESVDDAVEKLAAEHGNAPPDVFTNDRFDEVMALLRPVEEQTAGGNNCESPVEPSAKNVPYEQRRKLRHIKEARQRLATIYDAAHPAAQRLMDQLIHVPPLGLGAEKVVYDRGDGTVLAFLTSSTDKCTPTSQKVAFYQRKLVHLLLPKHMPDIHLAATKPPLLILDKVEIPQNRKEKTIAFMRKPLSGLLLRYKFKKLGVWADTNKVNLPRDTKGNVNYIDTPYWIMERKRINRAIKKLSPPEKAKAKRYFARIESLGHTIN